MTGVILAGGKSRRMGRHKLFVKAGGVSLFHRVYSVLYQIFPEIIVVANDPECFQSYPVRVIPDIFPNKGALGGLYTGIKNASADSSFCFAGDMPFLNIRLIRAMMKKYEEGDVIIPKTSDGLQPLHAIYSKKCLTPIEGLLSRGNLKIIDFFRGLTVIYIAEREIRSYDPMLISFLNINTKEDLRRAEEILARAPHMESR